MKRLILSFLSLIFIAVAWGQQLNHRVLRGETLESIAQKYNISVDDIKKSNPNVTRIYVGLVLIIPQNEHNNGNPNSIPEQNNAVTLQPIAPSISPFQESDNSTNEGIHLEKDYSNFEVGIITDKKFKFDGIGLCLGWVSNGFAIRFATTIKQPNYENIKDQQNFEIDAGYNVRVRLAEFAFIDLRPSVYYSHESHEAVVGSELKQSKYGKGSYYSTKVWEKKKSDTYGFLFEPKIGIQFNKIVLNLGYELSFSKFKLKKDYKGEGVYLGLSYYM